ncbi:hypothetical protein EB796_001426 [Bugula neritina]|uniref:LYPD6 n=1 Tax=Bugula neritina TaxID=10212 RepID=A0A7J7KQ37_BUGNE|nr:hypothetical protein EB796_001426 [Bugula neritina]
MMMAYRLLMLTALLLPDLQFSESVLTGTNLTCYHCKETFQHEYVYNSKCQRQLSNVDVRPCGSQDKYCMTKRIEKNGIPTHFERTCVDECYYGCRYDKFGLTTLTCTSCCQEEQCNTDNNGNHPALSHVFVLFIFIMKSCI